MQTRVWLGLGAFTLALGLVAALSAADQPSPEKIAGLVEKLGSSDFTEREKATKELEALGEKAFDALKKGTQHEDLETKRRAEELLKKVEAKVLTKKVLEPTRVQFTFKDTPLTEAIAEVQKKTGLTITLNDPQNKLADRKVTLDTGDTTLWEAVDLFVKKAGLVESVNASEVIGPGAQPLPRPVLRPGIKIQPVPLPRALPAPAPAPLPEDAPPGKIPQQIALPAGAVQVVPAQQVQPVPPIANKVRPGFPGMMPNTLVLSDGQPKDLPTHYAGAVRIRALPGDTVIPGFARPEGELLVPLQVTAEPKMQLQSLVGVRIEKAVDDQDQGLLQAMADPNENVPVPQVGNVLLAKAAFVARPGVMPGFTAPVPVRLKKGEKASKSLKELSGVVSMQVRPAAEEIMAIEKLMEAAGKEAKADGGGRVKVLDVSKTDKGVTLKVEFVQPQDVQGGVGFPGGPIQIMPLPAPVPLPAPAPALPQQQINAQVQVQVQIGGRATPVIPGGANGLSVQDAKGQTLPMSATQVQAVNNNGAVVWQYTFTIPTQKNLGEPAKLVYSGSRLVTVDVPFTLKNVPL